MPSRTLCFQQIIMDGVRVKISEKYKPPPKISISMTYAQRVAANTQIRESLPNYEFVLENRVLEKLKEWKSTRTSILEERLSRLQLLNESVEKTNQNVEETPDHKEIGSVNTTLSNSTSAYFNILTPIPLGLSKNTSHNISINQNAFNISEFEADTSSPFDNVALKSINDMEELAKVLETEENSINKVSARETTNFGLNFPASHNSRIESRHNKRLDPQPTSYRYENFASNPATYSSVSTINSHLIRNEKFVNPANPNFKTVPDILTALNGHLTSSGSVQNEPDYEPNKPSYSMAHTVAESPLNGLPESVKNLAKSVSLMGFPLSRVARACKAFGDDNKKVVDHLLAMSDLLDLGFSEEQASEALLSCDNDRDKALEKLIS